MNRESRVRRPFRIVSKVVNFRDKVLKLFNKLFLKKVIFFKNGKKTYKKTPIRGAL